MKLGVHEETGEQVAVKIMDKSDIRAQEMTMNVRREVSFVFALTTYFGGPTEIVANTHTCPLFTDRHHESTETQKHCQSSSSPYEL